MKAETYFRRETRETSRPRESPFIEGKQVPIISPAERIPPRTRSDSDTYLCSISVRVRRRWQCFIAEEVQSIGDRSTAIGTVTIRAVRECTGGVKSDDETR